MHDFLNFKERYSGEADQKRRNILNAVLALLIIGAIFLAVEAASAMKEFGNIGAGVPATNTITVSGEGEVFAIPDIAEITFSAHVEAKTVADAQKQVTDTMNVTLDFVKSSGVEEKDIKTVNYSANPRYDYVQASCVPGYCPPGKQVLAGYEVTHTVMVKVRDTGKVGTILDGLGQQKVTDIYGPNFSIDDEQTLQAEARKKAIEDAKAKAKILTNDLGVRIVRIVGFNESGNYPIYLQKGYGLGGAIDAAERSTTPSVPTGENKIVSNVTIVYEVR